MSSPCENLALFVDGELGEVDAENFRHHLASCDRCAVRFQEVMHLEMMATLSYPQEQAPQAVPATRARLRLPRWSRRALASAAALWLAALALVLLRPADPDLWQVKASTRHLEARLSYPLADSHRPYEPMRGETHTIRPLSVRALARLEERGDLEGIAAAYLLQDDYKQAAQVLTHAAPSPDRDNDEAVIALQRGELERALELLRRAITARPRHAQALWNRGLVLRELGLDGLAETCFLQVAALGEPGWSQEAQAHADFVRQRRIRRRAELDREARGLAGQLLQSGAPLPMEQARRQPEVVRAALYEAMRSAPSGSQVRALLPLARELDRAGEGGGLEGYVSEIAARDFSCRAPLAREYARLLQGEHPSPAALLDQLRSAGEGDILLGALLRTPGRRRAEVEQTARESAEPRFRLTAEWEQARREEARGMRDEADTRYLRVSRACVALGLSPDCGEIE